MIEFLKSKYKESTGYEAPIPMGIAKRETGQ